MRKGERERKSTREKAREREREHLSTVKSWLLLWMGYTPYMAPPYSSATIHGTTIHVATIHGKYTPYIAPLHIASTHHTEQRPIHTIATTGKRQSNYQWALSNIRSLLQTSPTKTGLFPENPWNLRSLLIVCHNVIKFRGVGRGKMRKKTRKCV